MQFDNETKKITVETTKTITEEYDFDSVLAKRNEYLERTLGCFNRLVESQKLVNFGVENGMEDKVEFSGDLKKIIDLANEIISGV
jgi:hypothetical protein